VPVLEERISNLFVFIPLKIPPDLPLDGIQCQTYFC